MRNSIGLPWGLAALLMVSVAGNILLYFKVDDLERANCYLNGSLLSFAGVTSEVVKQGKLSLDDVKRSGMIGNPPYAQGKTYLIDVDDHHNMGIKYIFDTDGKLAGWCPVQPVGDDPDHPTIECMRRAQVPHNVDDM